MESLCWDGHRRNHGDWRVVKGGRPYVGDSTKDLVGQVKFIAIAPMENV